MSLSEEIIKELSENLHISIEEAEEYAEDNYRGCYESFEDYGMALLEENGDLDGLDYGLRCYFDFKAYGRDLEHDHFGLEDGHKIHIFYNA